MIAYGKVVIEENYTGGSVNSRIQTTHESTKIRNRQQLLTDIIAQLDRLETEDSVDFKVYADKLTREPQRMEITFRRQLN